MLKSHPERLRFCLAMLRLGVFAVMLPWTLDKFVRPEHAERIFQHFYHISTLTPVYAYALGAIQLVLVLAFVLGIKKTITYGAVLALHAVSTLSAYHQYLTPYEGTNLLFFAAWPMLAACVALFLLREQDTAFTLSKSKRWT